MTLHDKINVRGLAEEFPKIGRKEFIQRFRRLKIGSTGDFANSFQVASQMKGNQIILWITYAYYADFTHLGVGKGMGLEDTAVRKLIGSGRKPKPWKKGIGHMRYRLGELYGDVVGQDMAKNVADQIARLGAPPLMIFKRQ
jgi:hypothetical protein